MSVVQLLSKTGCEPNIFILENQCSGELILAFEKSNVAYQKVPPNIRRRNSAERAIQTWKAHFIAGLSTIDPSFPISEWDRLVEQGEINLNILRNARVNPKLSAYAYLCGVFDYNKTPLASPGIKLVVHQKPDKRGTCQPRGEVGFYTGPALNHYRCVKYFDSKSRREKINDTVTFIPSSIPVPETTTEDFLIQAVDDIRQLLKSPIDNLPKIHAGNPTQTTIQQIAALFRKNDTTSCEPSKNDSTFQSTPVQNKIPYDATLGKKLLDVTPPRVFPDTPVHIRQSTIGKTRLQTYQYSNFSNHHRNFLQTMFLQPAFKPRTIEK